MKKFLFICAFVLAAGAVFAAPRASRALAELNGRGSQIKFEELTVEGMQPVKVADIPGKGEYYNIHSVDLTGEWKTFSISFVPTGKSFIFSFRGGPTHGNWVDYDDIKVEGAELYNPSFEIINDDNEIDGWRYYNANSAKIGQNDAGEGKNYVTCSALAAIRQGMKTVPGQKVTITFKARQGTPVPAGEKGWASSGSRKVF